MRINAIGSGYEEDDISALFSLYPFTPEPSHFSPSSPNSADDKTSPRPLPVIVVPKVDHPGHLSQLARLIKQGRGTDGGQATRRSARGMTRADHLVRFVASADVGGRVPVIASIESAEALWNVGDIASWRGEGCSMSGLLFAAEDFCASTGITRSKSRIELLHARSRMVLAAKAFNVPAIDMVCINFKDDAVLKEECEEGKRLGFDGKVCPVSSCQQYLRQPL